MRQLTFVEAGRVEWQEAPDAVLPGSAGALVRPLAVARCDLDLPMAMAGLFPGPFPVGHETVAEVMVVGDEVRARKPGDRGRISSGWATASGAARRRGSGRGRNGQVGRPLRGGRRGGCGRPQGSLCRR